MINMIGRRYDRLVILAKDHVITTDKGRHDAVYLCECDCGKTLHRRASVLRHRGYIQQCPDCIAAANKAASDASTNHELRSTYDGMIYRCHGTGSAAAHAYYRDRGVKVCDRWRESFHNFVADMGPRPTGKTLDRIDNDGDYTPENCRWATQEEQVWNRSNTLWVTINGKTAHLRDWCRVIDRTLSSVSETARVRGVSLEEVIRRAWAAKQRGRKHIDWS